ncbi:MAG: hypothetical protein A3F35_01350 [Candidatus Woykebacteria bacterium RIFCSPHIGHO2_12_FULL_45_10]|uniref:ComEC/Rec2-related protein domain-containing protein n=1 Tax=Candidatus Woykebacteria bacterium RIFCSPHIGHO2_12_FULL_45_10 TaxID=1802603 RepID=A0A1G1WS03_9BACT|nr:MAG: hypothetical protein A3F35_01350 [Candidatus Woykebacteria bacterium RIFCSPHIGHO2_12_FULL_45_10]
MSTKAVKGLLVAVFIASLVWTRFVIWNQAKPVYHEGQKLVLTGYLLEEPRRAGTGASFKFSGVFVTTNQTQLHYGDKLKLTGNYSKGRLAFPGIERGENSSLFYQSLAWLRNNLRSKTQELFPEPEAGLILGIVLGDKSDLDSQLEKDLKTTGTIHVAVVSGFNISLVGGALLALAKFIKRRRAVLLSLVAIVLYSLLSGFTPPTMRALIMCASVYLGTLTGRVVYPLYTLVAAALILYLLDPGVLFDIGFQLSFLATGGIMLFSQALQDKIPSFMKLFGADLSTSLAAQLLVTPILFYNFGRVSLVSPIANALTLWVIAPVTIMSFVILCISFIAFPIAFILALIALPLVKYFVFAVEILAKLPLASVEIGKNNVFLVVGYFLLALSAALNLFIKKNAIKNP